MRALVCLVLGLSLTGCSFYARSQDDYRKVTRELVKTRQADLKTCYKKAIKEDESAGGDVTVAFQVEAKTGRVHSAAIVPERTTASEALGQCVVTAIDGLVLDPPDQRTAQAEFVWTFEQS